MCCACQTPRHSPLFLVFGVQRENVNQLKTSNGYNFPLSGCAHFQLKPHVELNAYFPTVPNL